MTRHLLEEDRKADQPEDMDQLKRSTMTPSTIWESMILRLHQIRMGIESSTAIKDEEKHRCTVSRLRLRGRPRNGDSQLIYAL